ncbi:MAG TPA: hypothetical protein VJK52_04095, partial [Candidatus Nanoarchaeia archaeon]|nr:hypothetical protein [Candidatus Nanoarchaeia archaeon]
GDARNVQTKVNLPLLPALLSSFGSAFPRTFVTVSNRPEILNQSLALALQASGRTHDIPRLVGFAEPDKVRLDLLIRRALIDQSVLPADAAHLSTSAYTIGHHNDPLPVATAVTIEYLLRGADEMPRKDYRLVEFTLAQQGLFHESLLRWPTDQIRRAKGAGFKGARSPTQESSGQAILHCVWAILNRDRMVNAAVPYTTDSGVLFVELPVIFSERGTPLIYTPEHHTLIPDLHRQAYDLRTQQIAADIRSHQLSGAIPNGTIHTSLSTPTEFEHTKSKPRKPALPIGTELEGLEIFGMANDRVLRWVLGMGPDPRAAYVVDHCAPGDKRSLIAFTLAQEPFCADASGKLYALDRRTLRPRLLHDCREPISALASHADRLAVGLDNSPTVLLYDHGIWQPYAVPEIVSPMALCFAELPQGLRLFVGGKQGVLSLPLSPHDVAVQSEHYSGVSGWVTQISVSPSGEIIAMLSGNSIAQWHPDVPAQPRLYQFPEPTTMAMAAPGFSPKLFVYGASGVAAPDVTAGICATVDTPVRKPAILYFLGPLGPENRLLIGESEGTIRVFDQFHHYAPLSLSPLLSIKTFATRGIDGTT